MELLKDYDYTIKYHPRKANIVVDALSRKTVEIAAEIICYERENLMALRAMNVNLKVRDNHILATLQINMSLVDQIRDTQI